MADGFVIDAVPIDLPGLRSEAGLRLMLGLLQTGHYEDEEGRNDSIVLSNSPTFTGFVM